MNVLNVVSTLITIDILHYSHRYDGLALSTAKPPEHHNKLTILPTNIDVYVKKKITFFGLLSRVNKLDLYGFFVLNVNRT